jgi:nucleoside-diphosphate-sugar epimerase
MFNTGTLRYDRFLSEAGEDDAGSSFASAVAGHTVLVTGAGGYIGSALVKAIAAARPTRVGAYRQSVDGSHVTIRSRAPVHSSHFSFPNLEFCKDPVPFRVIATLGA